MTSRPFLMDGTYVVRTSSAIAASPVRQTPRNLGRTIGEEQGIQRHGIWRTPTHGRSEESARAQQKLASVAVVVDAMDEKARAFYRGYGFIDVPDRPNRLFIPMQTVALLFLEV